MKRRLDSLILVIVFLIIPAIANAQNWSGIIDSKRAIDWTQAGLPGSNLPDANWPICTTIAPYSGSAATITNAIASCQSAHPTGGVVLLGAGTFTISSSIQFPSNATGHVVLRGAGATQTTLAFSSQSGASALIRASNNDGTYAAQGGAPNWVQVTSGQAKGSKQLTLSSLNASGGGHVVAGSVLVLNQCDTGFVGHGLGAACTGTANDNLGYFHCQNAWSATNVGCAVASEGGVSSWRNGSSEMEGVVVTAINQGGCGSTCVTLSKPIEQPDWGSDTQAVVIQPSPFVGVENMTIDATTASAANTGNIIALNYFNVLHGWVSGVRTMNVDKTHISFADCFGCLIKDSYFFGTGAPITEAGDKNAMRLVAGANNLIQNNICQETKGCIFSSDAVPEQADVIAYNFATNQYNHQNANMGTFIDFHGAGTAYTLIEGNAGPFITPDGDHGAELSLTFFRNFIWGWTSCANSDAHGPVCGAGHTANSGINQTSLRMFYGNRYNNIVANVFGTPGWSTNYKSFGAFDNNSVYVLGGGQSVGGFNQPTDTLVAITTLLWDNWDTVNNATQFNTAEVPTSAPTYPNSVPTLCGSGQSCPASFYLSAKPSWFGSAPWPVIGPDVNSGNIGQCAGTFDAPGKFNGVAASSSSQCAGSSLNTAWAGHVNANPAMACYFSMGGLPDGTGNILPFDANACYGGSLSVNAPDPPPSTNPAPPTNLVIQVD